MREFRNSVQKNGMISNSSTIVFDNNNNRVNDNIKYQTSFQIASKYLNEAQFHCEAAVISLNQKTNSLRNMKENIPTKSSMTSNSTTSSNSAAFNSYKDNNIRHIVGLETAQSLLSRGNKMAFYTFYNFLGMYI